MFGDLDQFHGGDEGTDQMSEAAREVFREQMRAASQQIKAIQKGEQKRKKKEDKLAKLLSQFLQRRSGRTDLAFLAAQVLALNIPPAFILSVLLLGDRESQQELTMTAKEDDNGLEVEVMSGDMVQNITLDEDELALLRTEDEARSQQIIDEVLIWMEIMYMQARNDKIRMLRNGYDSDVSEDNETPSSDSHIIRLPIIEYMAAVMNHFVTDNGLNITPKNTEILARAILQKIFMVLEESSAS